MTPLVLKKLVEEAFVKNALVLPKLVLVPLAIVALVAKRLVEDARVLKSVVLVALVVTTSVNVFTPAKDWDEVDTSPRADTDALGKEKV
jgi:hypothetical protein